MCCECRVGLAREVMLTMCRTNNGLIHILDKVMSPINGEKLSSGNATNSASKPSAAIGLSEHVTSHVVFAFAVVGFAILMC